MKGKRPKKGVALAITTAAVALWAAAGERPEVTITTAAQQASIAPSMAVAALMPVADVAAEAGLGPEWDLPNLDHERVDYWVDRFQNVPEMRKKFDGFLERGGTWAPMILEKLQERGMPLDLLYLAMIESGFNPSATSHARAAGIWQFIAETGKRYGLEIDRAVDERRDPFRATDAALDYLQDLHDRFGSWYLAAASYNTGENRVGRAMRTEFGRERARGEEDYYRIWDRLPSETRDYVPLMIAAARITKDPSFYGFSPLQPRGFTWKEVNAAPSTTLADLAAQHGVTVDEIRALNPHFRIHRTPNDRHYAVRIPTSAITAGAAATD